MDLLELSETELKKLKVKELKKLIEEQKLFELKKSHKKKDLIEKIKEVKKEYEDSDSEESEQEEVKNEPKVEEIIEKIEDLTVKVKPTVELKTVKKTTNKFEKKDETKNYIIFNSNILYEVCQILKELVDNCLIVFNKDGFKINMVDKCLVSLINIQINHCYDDYNFLDEQYKIVINITELLKILDCKENNQKIKFIFTDDFLEIFYYTQTENFDKFKLHLLDENLVDELNEFDIEFSESIEISSRDLSKMCSKIKKFDNKMNIIIESDNLKLSSKNKTIELNDKLYKKSTHLDTTLLLKYVLIFCKTDKLCSNLEILYSNDQSPIKFVYNNNTNLKIEYIITPQNDEDDY